MGLINFLIVKMLVIQNLQIEITILQKRGYTYLLQSDCNPKKIFEYVSNYLDNSEKIDEQVKILN